MIAVDVFKYSPKILATVYVPVRLKRPVDSLIQKPFTPAHIAPSQSCPDPHVWF